jgi:hypothetical protein
LLKGLSENVSATVRIRKRESLLPVYFSLVYLSLKFRYIVCFMIIWVYIKDSR